MNTDLTLTPGSNHRDQTASTRANKHTGDNAWISPVHYVNIRSTSQLSPSLNDGSTSGTHPSFSQR